MKRKWLALLAAGLSAITVLSFSACTAGGSSNSAPTSSTSGTSSNSGASSNGGTSNSGTSDSTTPEVTKTRKEQVLEFVDSINHAEVASVNAYATDYDDMVAYLKEQHIIEADAQGVDMNTTEGYFWNATSGNYESSAIAFAEKAYDYNGVYLMWWDVAKVTNYSDYYYNLESRGRITISGGAYTLAAASINGCYAIGFSDFSKTMDQYESSGSECKKDSESWDEYYARKDAALKVAKEEHSSQLDIFDAIDDTIPSIDYFKSVDELTTRLNKAGFISNQQLGNPVDLNKVYTFTYIDRNDAEQTDYVCFASKAYQYGDITIYFYDPSESLYSMLTYAYMFTNLKENKTTEVYYGNSSGWSNWYYEGQVYKYNASNAYDENGTTLTYSVDGIYGNFAISVAEEA